MKGVILVEKGKVALGERPTPTPGPFEALIRVTAAVSMHSMKMLLFLRQIGIPGWKQNL